MNGGSAKWKFLMVVGVADTVYDARALLTCGGGFQVAIARDSTNTYTSSVSTMAGHLNANQGLLTAEYSEVVPVGYRYLQAIQTSYSVGVATAYGAATPGGGTLGVQSGMVVEGYR